MKHFILFFLITTVPLLSQTEELAKTGSKVLTIKEFKQRYELAPQFNRLYKGSEQQQKKNFLYSLLAEKLFALEAANTGLDSLPSVKQSIAAFKEMFMRDELYRQEVRNKSEQYYLNILKANIRSAAVMEARYIAFNSLPSAVAVETMLVNGIPFDTLYAANLDSGYASQITVKTGTFDMQLEDELFALKEGDFSEPLQHKNAFYIFNIDSKIDTLFKNVSEPQKLVERIEKYSREQAEEIRYEEFMKEFFGNIKAEANVPLMKTIAGKISDVYLERNSSNNSGAAPVMTLTMKDVFDIRGEFPADSLNLVYAEVEDSSLSLASFFEHLLYDEFTVDTLTYNAVINTINAKTKRFIEHYYLTKEAYRRGLDTDASVLTSIAMWKDYFLSKAYQEQFSDSAVISDAEVLEYYNRRYNKEGGGLYVNIVEVLVDSLAAADFILKEIDKGVPIEKLAEEYSMREWAQKRGGEFGFFPAGAYGDIGNIAAGMEIGEIFGPLIVPEGYSIFKLIDKKEMEIPDSQEFELMKESLRQDLAYRKYAQSFERNAVALARKYGISINYNLLDEISVTHINAMMFRLIGFGGKISAVPITLPFTDWIDQLLEEGVLIP